MKTIIDFRDSIDKRRVIIKHDKDVKIAFETRIDHLEWRDMEGNLIIERDYIVIRYPKDKKVDINKLELRYDDKYSLGIVKKEIEEDVELLFYNRVTFAWRLDDLEKIGLFKSVSQKIILEGDYSSELFPYYINARGVREITLNLTYLLMSNLFYVVRGLYKNINRRWMKKI